MPLFAFLLKLGQRNPGRTLEMNTDTIDVEHRALAIRDSEPTAVAIGEHKPLRYSLPELRQLGEVMFSSGMFKDLRSSQQAMVKLLAGAELGYGPFQSLRAFHVIEGKPVETSGEVTARIKRSGKYRMEAYFIAADGERLDPVRSKASETHGCVVLISEKRDAEWFNLEPSVFTKDDAATAGLLGKDVWKKYLRNMLFSRALTNAARFHCADIFGGPIYGPEELGQSVTIDSEGNETIDATPPRQPTKAAPPTQDDDTKRKNGLAAVHILKKERHLSDNLYHALLIELFSEACFDEHGVPSSTMLDHRQLRQLYAVMNERTKPEEVPV
jgi:hypothetical protein